MQGEADGVQNAAAYGGQDHRFTGPFEHRVLPRVGHNPPQEAPREFADAVLALIAATSSSSP